MENFMAVLRIEVKVDDELREVFEMDTTTSRDSVSQFWRFMKYVSQTMSSWSYRRIFPKE